MSRRGPQATAMSGADDGAFVQGYVTAAANLVLLHDQPGMAADVLLQLGKIDWRTIDAYDRGVLRKAGVFRDLHNRSRLRRGSQKEG